MSGGLLGGIGNALFGGSGAMGPGEIEQTMQSAYGMTPDVIDPWQTTTLTPGEDGGFVQQTSLSDVGQQQFDLRNQLAMQMAQGAAAGYDPASTADYEKRYLDNAMQLLGPQIETAEERTRNMLAQKGLPMGGEAFGDVYGGMVESGNRAKIAAAMDAMDRARGAQMQDFGMAQSAMGGLYSPGTSQPMVDPAGDYLNMLMQSQAQDQSWNQGMMGGLFTLGGAAMMAPTGTFTG